MGLVYKKDICCGCGLCAMKCPKNAITILEDEYGYLYPYIDELKCVKCNVCKNVCAYNKPTTNNQYSKKTYAAYSKDDSILKTTASGGLFTSIAISFIKNGGIVYGSSIKKEGKSFIVKHIKADTESDLKKIKGSKYIQSSIMEVYNSVKEELKEGKKILFSGTPCQIDAIKEFTENNENLYTIDIVCHGVPNNKLFNAYIEFLNQQQKIKINSFNFRDKSKGWGLNYSYSYLKNNKQNKIIKPSYKSSYYQMFLDAYTYRENCYNCPYANDKRIGDITIGDYWGIGEEHPELLKSNIKPEKGISCLIVNSLKGESLIKNSINNIQLYESEFEKVKKHNKQLNEPSKKNKDREYILEKYKNNGYQAIEEYYNKKNRIKNLIKSLLYLIPYRIRKK